MSIRPGPDTLGRGAPGGQPGAAEPPLEHQLWLADHVVLARVEPAGHPGVFRLLRVLRGDPARLRWRVEPILDLDEDPMWRLLGRDAAPGQELVLLLRGPRAVSPAHGAVELYPLGSRQDFVHAPGDPSVRREMTLTQLEARLSAPPFDTRACDHFERVGDYLLCQQTASADNTTAGRSGRLFRHGTELVGQYVGQTIHAGDPDGDALQFVFRGEASLAPGSVRGWERST